MPEGPELHLSSRFVKKVGDARQFIGKIVERLPSNRSPRLDEINARLSVTGRFTVTSWSRGKELMMAIKPLDFPESKKYRPEEWSIRFNFGMTGCFKFTRTSELPKHAKVCFTACDGPDFTLSFVDMRGFGRWTATSEWSENRGPCILQERDLFRSHVLSSLEASAFNKPICEVLLDQRYFNGVGNYLRAEALHRLGLSPFSCARELLSPLPLELKPGSSSDLLQLCHQLATEVVSLGGGKRYDVPLDLQEIMVEGVKIEPPVKKEEVEVDAFEDWLQCYYQPGMKNLVDHQGRTVWFAGSPGPMVPIARKQRHGGSPRKTKASSESPKSAELEDSDEDYSPAEKRPKRAGDRRGKTARDEGKTAETAAVGVTNRKSSSKKSKLKKGSAAGDAKAVKGEELENGKSSVSMNKPRAKKRAQSHTAKSKSSVIPTQSKQPATGGRRSKRLSGKLVQA